MRRNKMPLARTLVAKSKLPQYKLPQENSITSNRTDLDVKTYFSLSRFFVILGFLLLLCVGSLSATTYYSRASGNWTSNTTWSLTVGGGAITSGTYPVATDIVYVQGGFNVTVNAASACTNITVASGSTLTVAGNNFAVSGTLTDNGTVNFTSITGTKTFGNVIIAGGTWTSGAGETYPMANLTLSGSTINGSATGSFTVSSNLNVTTGTTNNLNALNLTVSGTTTVNGTVNFLSTTGTKTFADVIIAGGTWTSNAGETYPMTNLTLSGSTINGTATGTFTVSSNLTVTTGTTNNLNALNLTVTGTSTINGTVNYLSTLGTKSFGNVVIAGGTWTSNAAEAYPVTNLTLSGSTINGSSTGTFTASGNLAVTAGTVNNLYAFNLTVNGTTTVDGSAVFLSATGTKTFVGQVTVSASGTWDNDNVVSPINLRGGLTNNGTFYAGTSVYTFSNNAQALNGTLAIPNVTVTAITLTNNGNLTVATSLTGTGGLTQAAGSTLNLGADASITTLTATATGNTVNYSGVAQTAKVTTYQNLTLSGSGAKTFATTPTVNGILSLEGTVSVVVTTGVVTYGTSATLQYNKPAAYTATSEEWITPFAGTGGVIIANTGVITLNSAKVVNAPLTINSGSGLNTSSANNYALTFGGNFANSGTFTANASAITISGTGTQSISGFTTTGAVSSIKTGGVATLGGSVSGASLTINGVGGTLNGGSATHSFTGNVTITTGTLDGGSGTINLAGNWANTGTFTPSSSTVNLNGTTQSITGATTFTNLTLAGSGTKTFVNNVVANGSFSVNSGVVANLGTALTHTANSLYFAGAKQASSTWGGTGSAAENINTTYFAASTGIINATKNWTGATSTDWSVATNWSDGVVPTSTDNVIIPNVTNKPVIGAAATCKSITINASSSVTISGSNTLTVNGNWTNNGTFTANTSTVLFTAGAQSISGATTFYNLTAGGTGLKTFATTPTVNGILSLEGTGTVSTAPTYGSAATLQYNTTTARTVGVEWITPFVATGGVIIGSTGTITLNAAKVLSTSVPLTINSGSTLNTNSTSNYALTFGGSFVKSGTFTANASPITITGTGTQNIAGFTTTGAVTCDKSAGVATLTGNMIAASLANTTAGGTLNLGSGLSHTINGAWIRTNGTVNGGSSTLTITGDVTNTAGTFTPGTSTVIYSGANQATASVNYYNLTLSGSGTKTLQTSTTSIGGNLTIDNVIAAAVVGLTIGGDVILNQGFTFAGGAYTHNVGGNWTKNGWGSFTSTGNTINFTGNDASVNGTSTNVNIFNNVTITKTAGQTLSLGGSSTSFNIAGDLVLSSGAFAPGSIPAVISGNLTNNGGSVSNGTITMNGSGKTIGGTSSTTFNNLTINNNSGGILLGIGQTVNGTLTLSNGLLKLGAYNLTLGASAPAVAGSIYTGNMIVADGAGELRKIFTGTGSYVFPIGDSSDGIANVSPVTLNFTSGTFGVGAYAAVRVTDAKHPSNTSVSNYLTRYWTLSQSGISAFSCNVTANYEYGGDVVGQEGLQTAAIYSGALPWAEYSVLGTGTVTANAVSTFGDLTGIEPTKITTGTISGSPFCAGASVSVPYTISGTYVSGNIFTAQLSNATGSFASPVAIGTLTSTAAGTISGTIPAGTATGTGYRIRVVSSNPAKTSTDNGTDLVVYAQSATPTTTGGLICIGSTATLSASGAVSGEKYRWYDAATAGNLLKTSTDNTDNTYTTAVLAATTNYWVSIMNGGGCESSRTLVTATFPAVSADDQTTAGADSWIGHVYDGTNLNTYYGRYTEPEIFTQSFGGNTNCFTITSNSVARSIYTEQFSVRYRMNSTKRGLYVVDLGSDDGSRLYVDGTLLYNNWTDQAYVSRPRVLMSLTGSSALIYDFYENGGANQVGFQNLTQILANTLSTNTSQSINIGSTGTAISGDAFGTLPTGVSLSGTGYQWTYSTTPTGTRTNISGATGATYTPDATVSPFNTPGTYYLYRNTIVSGTNNVSPNPYVATNESNAATLVIYNPVITVSPTSLTGFSYIQGYGPSAQQSFTVSGTHLGSNITVTPPTDYEISTTSGSGFQSTAITLTQTGGTVAATTIYVRLKAGLAVGNYNLENVAATATSATTQNVSCSGTVNNVPLISVTPTALTGFNYIFGNGPSAQQSFAVSGSYLIANVTVTPPTDYEISTTSGSGFQSTPITLTQSGGTLASTTIYVRLKSGLAIGSYNLENIALTSTTAVTQNVAASGTVSNVPLITVTPTSLTGYNYIFGNGPSAQQSFSVSGTYLVSNISVTPPADYEISTTSGSGFQSTAITLTPTSGTVAATTIYVRLKAGLAVGSYNLENVASSATGAVTKNVAASGTVSNVPLISVTPTSLTGFSYIVGYGPSAQQSFSVSGTYLVSNITVTPPTDYEISTTSGSGFQSTAITLTQSGGTVAATTIYVRLKAGLVAGSYNSENVVLTATTAVTQNVACSGTVTTPTITTSPATLTGFSYSVGNGPSAQQSFTVSGVNLPTNITVTPSTNYEISTTSGSGFQSTPITLTQTGGTVASTTIYVRLKAGLAVGNYNSENIASSATGAVTKNVTCSGVVGAPTIVTSIASLTGFTYSYGTGPSTEQSFTVSGSYLTTNLVVTPPTDFEISLTSGSGFQSTPISLSQTSGVVNTTTIYVRLKAGLITGTYASENIAATSTGATTQNVVASGSVYATYCTSSGTTASAAGVTFVGFNTISNTTLTKTAGYNDYTATSTSVSISSSYALTVNLNTNGNNTAYATVWIDWNHNGDFSDAGETYSMGTARNRTNGATSLSPLSITIPATALAGSTRMRVSAKLNAASTACETAFNGEVEDYTLNVVIPTITTGTITGSPFVNGSSVSVPFTITGSYISGNVFTAQLSDSNGSFASPVSIGTLTGTTAGTISATIPVNATTGTGYRIRVVSSTPVINGSDNGVNLTINAVPYISVSPSTITGFTYPVGYGPSGEQSFTVSGANLTANISLIPSASFEISLTSSSTGTFVPSSLITLPVSGGAVATTTIYVRMKAGLALGAVAAEDIYVSSTGATSRLVSCSGTVVAAPVITTSVSTLTGFSYVFTAGPSAQQSFTVSGSNLVGDVIVTPPTDFEISTTNGSGYATTPITLTQTSGTLAATTIYIRMKIGLGVGSYSENVVVSTTSAVSKNVAMSGAVTASATIIASTSSLAGFIYTLGSGPSASQSFVLTGSNLGTNSITVTAPTNFEIATTAGGTYSATLTYTPSAGSVNATVYARLKSALAVASYGPSNVSLTSTGAVVKTVALSGSVVNTPTLLTSKSTLTGFGYMYGTGPSSEQSFTVSGASLTGNVTVTPPANYEISTTSGSGFQSTAITLTQTSGLVNPTVIYVRLKSGLTAGNYTGINITAVSSGLTKNVSLVGIVFVSPLITAGGGGEYCAGSTINLTSTGAEIVNRYWQGPNSYYSTAQNPSITNATTAMSGTYTVTGNVYVGGNLITNGDFEAGNTSFGSSYGYVAPTTNALWPEALYTVVASPRTAHDNFSACVDHTVGGTTPTGLQMVVNGAPTAGVVIWTQSVPVIPNASYEFSYWVQTVVATSPSQLQLYVNGVAAGPTYTADLTTCTWKQFIYNTTAGPTTTSLNLELINQNTVANGNDFALDDIVFKQTLPATSSTTVNVNPTLPVSVAVTASANPVYSNTPVTYTATPTNGGTAPAYQWKVNGVNVGTNSSTYTYTPVNGDVVTCVLTSNYPCPTGNPATASVVMVVNLRTNYWMGYIDTDWGKPGNWTNNFVPLTGDDVEYATVANFGTSAMRDLQLDMDRTIGSLINATTKRLLIPRQKGLTVNNTITTDGNGARIYIYCDSITANGSLIFHNSPSQPVYATVEMYSKAFWDMSNPVPSDRYHWQYFGIPLESIVAYPAFTGAYVRRWYETGTAIYNHWIQVSNSTTIVPFYGYELCQQSPKVYYFQGKLVNSDFNSGQLAVTPTALYPGQHVFANPYTAAIDIRQLTFGAQTEQTVYMYNTGTYNQWTSGGEAAPGNNPGQYTASTKQYAGLNSLPRQVPSMQAMLVKAMSNSSSATFGISYNSVVMNNASVQRAPSENVESATDKVSTLIDVKGAHAGDRMWIFSEPTCTRGFDNGYDAAKMLGTSLSPQIYAVESDGNYQVNAVADMNDTQLAFQAGSDAEYTMTFTHKNLKHYYPGVYLVDLIEKKIVDITESGSTYTFAAESTPSPINRFKIVTRYYEKEAPDENSNLKVFSAKGMIFVHNFSNRNGDTYLYDVAGHFVKKIPFTGNGITIVRANVIPGAYVAKCITETEEVTKRIIVR